MNKTCNCCGIEFDISNFPKAKNRIGKSYHRGICRFCITKKYKGKNRIYAERQKNDDLEKFRMSERERGKKWRSKHRLEHQVHLLVSRAIENGELVKMEKCSKCGKEGVRINAHHNDYNKPYDVIWLCDKCHAERHTEIRKKQELEFKRDQLAIEYKPESLVLEALEV